MSHYTHYSFDLWLTLIRSNPAYKKERINYFHKNFNFKKKSFEEVSVIFRSVDLMCNSINEKTGKNIDADEMYLMVIALINDNEYPLCEIDIAGIYDEMESLFYRYLPVVYSDETSDVLDHLKQNCNNTLSILSNTGFIRGVTLRKALKRLELERFFNFQLYSDETGFSKPNTAFFDLMLEKTKRLRNSELNLNEIIHIGDNLLADVGGANAAGISSLLINSNGTRILKLIENDRNLFLT